MPRSLALLVLLVAPTLFADDITVTHISRLPEMSFVWGRPNPTRDGWAAEGQQITWRADVKNFSAHAAANVPYRWLEDDRVIAVGTATLAANATTTIDLPATWSFARHRLAFEIGPAAGEESISNNRLEVFTDALAVGFWVEQSLYDYFRANQGKLGVGSTCWEDWAERQVAYSNDMAALAVFPETPNGVLDRWRIQKIVVVPDGALPLVAVDLPPRGNEYPPAATHPDTSDRTVDLEWGFRASTTTTYTNTNTTAVTIANPFFLAPIVIHEVGHARYLTDVYGFNVTQDPPGHEIDITENGVPIVGTTLPGGARPYFTPERGLMYGDYSFIDRYSAIALNRIAGARATYGNCNDPENVGAFLNDLPAQNVVTIRDSSGAPIADADVQIFQSAPGHADAWYAQDYDDIPDLTLHTDANGRVAVGRCPFSPDGKIVHYWRGSNAVAIVRAKKNGAWLYGFLEVRLFNMESWRGHTDVGNYDVVVRGDATCDNQLPVPVAPAWDATVDPRVTLTWNGTASATSYDVYASTDLTTPRLIGSTTGTSLTAYLPGRVYWWIVAQRGATCDPVHSEISRFEAPRPPKHHAASH